MLPCNKVPRDNKGSNRVPFSKGFPSHPFLWGKIEHLHLQLYTLKLSHLPWCRYGLIDESDSDNEAMTSEQRLQEVAQENQAEWNGAESIAQDEDGMQEG